MIQVQFSVDGTEAVIRGLKGIVIRVNVNAGNSVEAACRRIVGRARAAAPVLTGALRGSINYAMRGPTLGVVGLEQPGSRYWYLLEFGTRYVPAHPFMRPAAEPERGRFKIEMSNAVNRAVAYEQAYANYEKLRFG